MKSVNQEISELIAKDIAVQKCLQREIINIRSLAKYLLKEYRLSYTLDAVISAIRRYDLAVTSLVDQKDGQRIFSKMLISTKDTVAMILVKDNQFSKVAEDFLQEHKLKENLRLIKGKETITLFVNQKNFEEKTALFPKAAILEVQKNLSEVRLHFQEDIRTIKGVIARICSELALLDVNIEQVLYSFPDVLLYVKEENLPNALSSLRELRN